VCAAEFSHHSSHLTTSDFTSTATQCTLIDRSQGKLCRFTVHDLVHIMAATNHSALSSDKMRSDEER